MVLFCKAKWRSLITESIFQNRFMHVKNLEDWEQKIVFKKNKAFIEGNS